MVHVYSLEGKPVEEIDLPPVFETEFRPDMIRRAVIAAQTSRLQPKGTDVMAGKRTTAQTWGKGRGVARVRRVKGSRYAAAGKGAFSPSTVGGRRAHPPKTTKIIRERINKKERRQAIRSAIAATKDKVLVSSRGHDVVNVQELPLIVTDEFEEMRRTREIKKLFEKLGIWPDIRRVIKSRRIRAGRGKWRGRRYRQVIGPLVVIGRDRGIKRGAGNLPGIDVVKVSNLSAERLAPGGAPGRLTIWTKSAIQELRGI